MFTDIDSELQEPINSHQPEEPEKEHIETRPRTRLLTCDQLLAYEFERVNTIEENRKKFNHQKKSQKTEKLGKKRLSQSEGLGLLEDRERKNTLSTLASVETACTAGSKPGDSDEVIVVAPVSEQSKRKKETLKTHDKHSQAYFRIHKIIWKLIGVYAIINLVGMLNNRKAAKLTPLIVYSLCLIASFKFYEEATKFEHVKISCKNAQKVEKALKFFFFVDLGLFFVSVCGEAGFFFWLVRLIQLGRSPAQLYALVGISTFFCVVWISLCVYYKVVKVKVKGFKFLKKKEVSGAKRTRPRRRATQA